MEGVGCTFQMECWWILIYPKKDSYVHPCLLWLCWPNPYKIRQHDNPWILGRWRLGFPSPTQKIAFIACLNYIGHVLVELRALVEQRISCHLCHMLLPPATWTATFVGQGDFDLNATCLQLPFGNYMQLVGLFYDSQWTCNHKFEFISLETRGSYSISNLPLHFYKRRKNTSKSLG